MALTKDRESEICREMLKVLLGRKLSFEDVKRIRRESGNAAEDIGVPIEELMEFLEALLKEMFRESMKKGFTKESKNK